MYLALFSLEISVPWFEVNCSSSEIFRRVVVTWNSPGNRRECSALTFRREKRDQATTMLGPRWRGSASKICRRIHVVRPSKSHGRSFARKDVEQNKQDPSVEATWYETQNDPWEKQEWRGCPSAPRTKFSQADERGGSGLLQKGTTDDARRFRTRRHGRIHQIHSDAPSSKRAEFPKAFLIKRRRTQKSTRSGKTKWNSSTRVARESRASRWSSQAESPCRQTTHSKCTKLVVLAINEDSQAQQEKTKREYGDRDLWPLSLSKQQLTGHAKIRGPSPGAFDPLPSQPIRVCHTLRAKSAPHPLPGGEQNSCSALHCRKRKCDKKK